MKAKTQTLFFSLSSIGWRRGTGRGGALLLELPLSSVLPMNPWEHRTSNIQHPTANQWHWKPLVVRCWMLGVGCFPSVHGFNARIFRGILSPSDGERGFAAASYRTPA